MSSFDVGMTLREERLRRQLSLEEVGRQTKISGRFLQAIESDDFQLLPGVIFTRNFVRQYADVLKIDPGPLLAALPPYDLDTAPMPARSPRLSSRSEWDPRWNAGLVLAAWTVVACGAAAAVYVKFNHPVTPQLAQAAPVDARAPARPLAVAPLHDNHLVRVVITAREDCWVQVAADGNKPFTGMLKESESKSFASDSPVTLRTGNAGGLGITLNGKELDALGPEGQVRSVTLTAEGPRFAPKNPQASPDPL